MQSHVFDHQFVNPNWPEVVNLYPGAPGASMYVEWIVQKALVHTHLRMQVPLLSDKHFTSFVGRSWASLKIHCNRTVS